MYVIYLGQLKTGNQNQRDFFVNLLSKTKKRLFAKATLNVKDLSDNKGFWRTIKPYISNKSLSSKKKLLKEKGRHISDSKELTKLMNSSINIKGELDLKRDTETFLVTTITLDNILENINIMQR